MAIAFNHEPYLYHAPRVAVGFTKFLSRESLWGNVVGQRLLLGRQKRRLRGGRGLFFILKTEASYPVLPNSSLPPLFGFTK